MFKGPTFWEYAQPRKSASCQSHNKDDDGPEHSRDKVLDGRGKASFICKGRHARALSDGLKDSFQRKEFRPSIRVADSFLFLFF